MFSEIADALGEDVFYPIDPVFYKPLYRMPPVPLPPTKDNGTGWQWASFNGATCRYMQPDGSTKEAACAVRPSRRPLPPVDATPVATPAPVTTPAPATPTTTPATGTTNYLPWILGGLGLLLVFGGKGK